ncbi:hypothetical protein [Massilia sp. YMA4]|uniref:Gel scht n=1 Tax=[Empedobacter] haloabium TaxID=592317 RepID=A0ABZ1UPB8_9BURK|nr:hypothetical protein [Massilia sp. YMA4]AXA92705.1 hypothetical protein DPH57_17060 [Massilia sp. YMA4]
MNHVLTRAVAALSFAVAGLAAAAPQTADTTVPVPAARATYQLAPHEFDDYAFSYRLANGQVAEFVEQGDRQYVVVRNHGMTQTMSALQTKRVTPVQLLAVGPGKFVTRDGVELSFANEGEMVTITNFERLPRAKVAPADIGKPTLAFR